VQASATCLTQRDAHRGRVSSTLRVRPGYTARAQLQRTFEVAEFDAEPRECRRERVDDEPTAVAGDVIALVGSGSVWSAQSTQIGGVTRSSCLRCASPASVPGWASQKAQPTRRLLHHSASSSASQAAVQPRWKTAIASTSRTRCRSAREPERGPRERGDEIRVDELIDQVMASESSMSVVETDVASWTWARSSASNCSTDRMRLKLSQSPSRSPVIHSGIVRFDQRQDLLFQFTANKQDGLFRSVVDYWNLPRVSVFTQSRLARTSALLKVCLKPNKQTVRTLKSLLKTSMRSSSALAPTGPLSLRSVRRARTHPGNTVLYHLSTKFEPERLERVANTPCESDPMNCSPNRWRSAQTSTCGPTTVTKTTQTASITGSEAWNHCVPRLCHTLRACEEQTLHAGGTPSQRRRYRK